MKKAPLISAAYLVPFIMVTSLFLLWGVANDLTNPMVSAFKKVMPELSNFEASLVQLAFYGGYATMALPAALFIRRYSYKAGIVLGLGLYALGAFLFYPAAQYETFTFFLLSLYILTFGLAFLETTANPFILALGDPASATRRLNLAQAFNPMGSLLGMMIAQLLVISQLQSDDFSKNEYLALPVEEIAAIRAHDLDVISTPYLVLGGLVLLVMLLFVFVKIKDPAQGESLGLKETFARLKNNRRYWEGVVAQTFYVGAQIMCWTFIFQYVDNINESRPANNQLVATWYNMAAMICFLSSRWLAVYLSGFISPAKLMLRFAILGCLFCLGTIFIGGMIGLYCLVGISIAMSLMFPTIYGLALNGMGDEAKLASAGLIVAIVGGALMPPLQGNILDWGGDNFNDLQILGFIPEVNFSFILPFVCLLIVGVYSYRAYAIYGQDELS